MSRILITGATGNVGKEVIRNLLPSSKSYTVIAGVRDVEKESSQLNISGIEYCLFDFEDSNTFRQAFKNCDVLFLLRPPHISDVNRFFKPLVKAAKQYGVKHIVFLSVQGVEKSSIIPHNKIERLIVESAISYTFLRPAYFMQNFTTTLRKDIVENKMIFLPAGTARFTVIDVGDIGAAAATVLLHPLQHVNKSYELTNNEKLSFGEMAAKISAITQKKIRYVSPNLFRFYFQKRKEKMPATLIFVMMMLHYLPRFQKEPEVTEDIHRLTGKPPKAFDEFVEQNKSLFM